MYSKQISLQVLLSNYFFFLEQENSMILEAYN